MPDIGISFIMSAFLFVMLYVTGIVLAAAFWKRSPTACMLVLAGGVLNLLVVLLQVALILFKFDWGFDAMRSVIDLGLSVAQIVGYGLWLTAAFVGRAPAPAALPRADDDWDRPTAPRSRVEPGNTGFQDKP